MQGVIFSESTLTPVNTQARRVLPGHGTGLETQASNDESYHEEKSLAWMALLVLVNVAGGALLLSAMFVLPYLVAELLA